MTNNGIFVRDVTHNYFWVEVGELHQVLTTLVKMDEVVGHQMDKYGNKKVIIFDFTYGGNLVVIPMHFRDSIAKWAFIREADLKCFN